MFKLIHSENIKLYLQKSTLLMLISIVLLTTISSFVLRIYDIAPQRQNVWSALGGELWIMFFVNVFTIIVASGIVANEFNFGTIKFLLIRPVTRGKVLLSKYISVIIFGILLTVLLFIFAYATNSLLYSKTPLANSFSDISKIFALKYVEVFVYATIAFMVSVVTRNSAFTVGFSLVLLFAGPVIAYYLPNKYLLFSNIDIVNGTHMGFSLGVLALYMLVFNIISWTFFLKKDIRS